MELTGNGRFRLSFTLHPCGRDQPAGGRSSKSLKKPQNARPNARRTERNVRGTKRRTKQTMRFASTTGLLAAALLAVASATPSSPPKIPGKCQIECTPAFNAHPPFAPSSPVMSLRGGAVLEPKTLGEVDGILLKASAEGKLVVIDFSATVSESAVGRQRPPPRTRLSDFLFVCFLTRAGGRERQQC